MNNEKKWYESSAGTGAMSLTVRGGLVAIVPILIAILSSQGYDIDENTIVSFIDQVLTAIASVMVVFGVVRKAYYAYTKANQ